MKPVKFSEMKTVSGYPADQVISALQKEIRRGNTQSACFFGLELLESGKIFEAKFWERMMVIAVEDVAEANSVSIVRALKDNYYDLSNAKVWDRHMQGIKAVYLLSESKKDRIIGEIYDYLRMKRKENYKPKIPQYALDMHTKSGREQGKDYLHFLEESSKVNNVVKNKNDTYLRELLRFAKQGKRP